MFNPPPSLPPSLPRPLRTLQMTVSNSLVGRVIGRSGAKINRIQEISGAHITVSRNIPKSAERLVTIKVCVYCSELVM